MFKTKLHAVYCFAFTVLCILFYAAMHIIAETESGLMLASFLYFIAPLLCIEISVFFGINVYSQTGSIKTTVISALYSFAAFGMLAIIYEIYCSVSESLKFDTETLWTDLFFIAIVVSVVYFSALFTKKRRERKIERENDRINAKTNKTGNKVKLK
ncbi:hypothetical protein SDC9_99936 [bioreactor metagenome]|uniref:Uncharacterized protein n=1 Tax=bioreactor metagenome TaxID=1076179 RepID=A0A645ALH7_9ZZZZ|nr:hypothetical protein [Oscillospiraceae bacterium]